MSYKLIKENEHSYEVQHKNGSKFTVAKHGLSDKVHSRIKGYAQGGIVEPDQEGLDLNTAESVSLTSKRPLDIQPIPQEKPLIIEPAEQEQIREPAAVQQPVAQEMTQERVFGPKAQPQAQAPNQTIEALKSNIEESKAAIQGAATAQAQGAQEQANIYQNQYKKMKTLMDNHNANMQKIDSEIKQLTSDVTNQKIDPNRAWSNRSGANKVMASIGVLLSGIGSGLTGQGNMAMKVIDDEINRDIEAQKMELGKKENLLGINLRRYGDLQTATQATMLQLNGIVQGQIAAAAAKTNSQQAMQQARLQIADLNNKSILLMNDLAQKEAVRQAMQSLSGPGGGDSQVQMLPEEVRNRAVKIGGKYALAIDDNSAKEARKIVGANDAMIANLDKLMSLRQKYGSETIPGPVKQEMETIASSLQLAIKEAKQLGTLDKGAERFMEKLVANPTSYGFVLDQYKALKASQQREAMQRLKALGVDTSRLERQSEIQGQQQGAI